MCVRRLVWLATTPRRNERGCRLCDRNPELSSSLKRDHDPHSPILPGIKWYQEIVMRSSKDEGLR